MWNLRKKNSKEKLNKCRWELREWEAHTQQVSDEGTYLREPVFQPNQPNAPLRPILSMCGSVQYDASKWLCEILKPVLDYYNVRSIKDSFTFVDKIRKSGVPRDGYMCSFDVVNLFTSVPLAEVIDICADALYRNNEIEPVTTTLSEDSFRELMRLATSGVFV